MKKSWYVRNLKTWLTYKVEAKDQASALCQGIEALQECQAVESRESATHAVYEGELYGPETFYQCGKGAV